MVFRYKKYAPTVLRPVIPITLKRHGIVLSYEVLVDSGADANIFDAEIGELLWLKIESGQRGQVSGIAGQTANYYIHPIELEVGGWSYTTHVGFLPTVTNGLNHGVVGQRGFFDEFIVKFDLLRETVELKPRRLA